ncbi:Gfo/Idh/MocA family protein [Paenibacillus agricola]|uniref:Gfo/Idh/MocA family oxidoreductase n=1 Tax=Paenibacillus agricola TaxID=2716264 RepID=A0ABX0J645_9BACL|nr:Gfo/Idh/MocA family oxidoreductase [Paenibacillus agricola]NHN30312.1 Gfo/Idh/MocA family oxidoreductase [Paenibacillus agricola]
MKLRIGFIGTGRYADKHQCILSQMEGISVVAFCGRSKDSAERAAINWPEAKAFTNVVQMLESCKLDAVYVCVPPMGHGEIEMHLIERGIPFFVEKPLGLELTDGMRLLRDQAAEKQLITSVGYNWRYLDSVAKARELLLEGTVGMALGYFMSSFPQIAWWRRLDGSGGQFNEQTTHIVDLIRYLCGEIEELYAAFGKRRTHEVPEGMDIPDVGTVTLKFVSGMVATISNTCILPRGHHMGLDLYTTSGVLEIRSNSLKEIGRDRTVEYKNSSDPYILENEAFVHALRTGDTSGILSDYGDAFRTFEVTSAASLSAAEGRIIRFRTSTGKES